MRSAFVVPQGRRTKLGRRFRMKADSHDAARVRSESARGPFPNEGVEPALPPGREIGVQAPLPMPLQPVRRSLQGLPTSLRQAGPVPAGAAEAPV